MFGIFLVILGVVGLALNHLFTGQETISWVLIGTGGGLLVLNILAFVVVLIFGAKSAKKIDSKW